MSFDKELEDLIHKLEAEHQKMIEEVRDYLKQGHIENMPAEKLEQLHKVVNDHLEHTAVLKTIKRNINA